MLSSPSFLAPMACKTALSSWLPVLLAGALAPFAHSATPYLITFEEPTHHLGSLPTLGAAPDRVTEILNGSPTITADPTGLSSQALELRAGTAYSQIRLAASSVLGTSYKLECDLYTS